MNFDDYHAGRQSNQQQPPLFQGRVYGLPTLGQAQRTGRQFTQEQQQYLQVFGGRRRTPQAGGGGGSVYGQQPAPQPWSPMGLDQGMQTTGGTGPVYGGGQQFGAPPMPQPGMMTGGMYGGSETMRRSLLPPWMRRRYGTRSYAQYTQPQQPQQPRPQYSTQQIY